MLGYWNYLQNKKNWILKDIQFSLALHLKGLKMKCEHFRYHSIVPVLHYSNIPILIT